MVALFVVIPTGTMETDNFGLSPRMFPMVTMSIIAGLAVVTLIFSLIKSRKPSATQQQPNGLLGVVLLILATFIGTVTMGQFGIVIGGAVIIFLAALAVRERRPHVLIGLEIVAVLLLVLVEWSGL
jgi:uncharacterized membrane protein